MVDSDAVKATDSERAKCAGEPLGFCAALIDIKGDWAEFCQRFGFPSWNTILYPCLFCKTTMANLYDASALDASRPLSVTTHADYDRSCTACEVWVNFEDLATFNAAKTQLSYDKRADGSRGRALLQDVRTADDLLRRSDRLEPTPGLVDVGLIEQLELQTQVCFWRKTSETRTRHRNPLVNPHIGITLERLAIDK